MVAVYPPVSLQSFCYRTHQSILRLAKLSCICPLNVYMLLFSPLPWSGILNIDTKGAPKCLYSEPGKEFTVVTTAFVSDTDIVDLSSDIPWIKFYPVLESLARCFVYSLHVPSWQGQEDDIVADIVQETWRRIIERSRKAEQGEAPPIHSLKGMMTVIAHNYCKDLGRRDRRLLRIQPQDASLQTHLIMRDQQCLLESGTENVYQEALFKLVAREIANFPGKQRNAVLIDLANRMRFETQPTPLQAAFLEVGIDLRHYQKPLPADPQERSRHVSLLTHAYKRIARLECVQKYIACA